MKVNERREKSDGFETMRAGRNDLNNPPTAAGGIGFRGSDGDLDSEGVVRGANGACFLTQRGGYNLDMVAHRPPLKPVQLFV